MKRKERLHIKEATVTLSHLRDIFKDKVWKREGLKKLGKILRDETMGKKKANERKQTSVKLVVLKLNNVTITPGSTGQQSLQLAPGGALCLMFDLWMLL